MTEITNLFNEPSPPHASKHKPTTRKNQSMSERERYLWRTYKIKIKLPSTDRSNEKVRAVYICNDSKELFGQKVVIVDINTHADTPLGCSNSYCVRFKCKKSNNILVEYVTKQKQKSVTDYFYFY